MLISVVGKPVSSDIKDILPIYKVTFADVVGTEEQVAKKLLIDESEVADFLNYYYSETTQGRTVYLFRFAVTDYTAFEVTWSNGGLWGTHTDEAYIAEETVFLDFDVISLTFTDDNVETIIPVVSNPIDIVGNITSPPDNSPPWWVWLIVALLVVVILAVIFPPVLNVVMFVLRGVWWLLSLPFKAIVRAIKERK